VTTDSGGAVTRPLTVVSGSPPRAGQLAGLARFPGAGHVESWNIGRARYTSLLRSFLSPVAP